MTAESIRNRLKDDYAPNPGGIQESTARFRAAGTSRKKGSRTCERPPLRGNGIKLSVPFRGLCKPPLSRWSDFLIILFVDLNHILLLIFYLIFSSAVKGYDKDGATACKKQGKPKRYRIVVPPFEETVYLRMYRYRFLRQYQPDLSSRSEWFRFAFQDLQSPLQSMKKRRRKDLIFLSPFAVKGKAKFLSRLL